MATDAEGRAIPQRRQVTREEALEYHSREPQGKVRVVPTKPTGSQRDLSLAYTPGVAHACRAIADDPLAGFQYTARGNLVAVVSDGTAVLGLGDIGPLAAKPVMEGKAVLFKRFADVDVFDLELATTDVDEIVRTVKLLEPTFGGVNLEDITAPGCFEIERRLKEEMSIPVFHDDQHGTAIISGAALLNALEVAGKDLADVRIVFSGAGAAAFGCLRLYLELGAKKENFLLVDSKGVVHQGREAGMTEGKAEFAADTERRTLADALEGADVFIGLSVGGLVDADMVRSMADNPIVFAMANPDPEISWEEATEARDDVIMATGRSDYPNQVNNVLGFPFIFRGALDVRATDVNVPMMLAAVRALAELAKEDVPDPVLAAYGLESLRFGREYLIPKPFDHRVLLRVPPAVARAAEESGVAQVPIDDWDAYEHRLETFISRRLEVMRDVLDRARRDPRRVVFPEGEEDKILRAAKILVDRGIAHPVLLGRPQVVRDKLAELDLDMVSNGGEDDEITIVHVKESEHLDAYAERLHELRRRHGVTLEDAHHLMRSHNYFGTMMVERGDADALISGISQHYPETIRPALQIVGTREGVRKVCGCYILILEDRMFFLADTTVNIEPDADDLAEIAGLTADFARRFGVEPRVAMLSFSNFGSNTHPRAREVRRAVEILHEQRPDLEVDGEMQADTAVLPRLLQEIYPWSRLSGPANVLVFPELQSANAAYKLIWRLAEAEAIGPVLLGVGKPVHLLQRGAEVSEVVNMAALAVVEAQEG